MGHKKNLLIFTAAATSAVVVIWSFATIQGSQRTYEVHPQITMPGYRTDSVRALDAYERLMERYMDLVEKNLNDIEADFEKTAAQIDSIDTKLTELCERTARIEKALGIEPPKKTKPKPPVGRQTNSDKQAKQESR
jgi:hypothetical protein